MPSLTFDARAIAALASKRVGRTVSDKQVRDMARDNIARFDKTTHPAYQSHAYSVTERDRLLALFDARAGKVAPKRRAPRKVATPATPEA